MAKLMGPSGFVYGLDHVNELVFSSIQNVSKSHEDLISTGKVILKSQKDPILGLKEYGPYDCIHVGAPQKKVPR